MEWSAQHFKATAAQLMPVSTRTIDGA